MKIIIEDSDVENVQKIASNYYCVDLTKRQARSLINKNKQLAVELLYGGLDTAGRECLCDVLVETILGDIPQVVRDEVMPELGWHWPLNMSDLRYTKYFYKKFTEEAIKKKFKIQKERIT